MVKHGSVDARYPTPCGGGMTFETRVVELERGVYAVQARRQARTRRHRVGLDTGVGTTPEALDKIFRARFGR